MSHSYESLFNLNEEEEGEEAPLHDVAVLIFDSLLILNTAYTPGDNELREVSSSAAVSKPKRVFQQRKKMEHTSQKNQMQN